MNLLLNDEAKRILQLQQKSLRTQQSYADWIYRFLIFNEQHSPGEFSDKGILMFLDFLTKDLHHSPATRNLALQSISFLFRNVLHQPIKNKPALRLQKHLNQPETLSRNEINLILNQLNEETRIMVSLLYGCGLNLKECLSLQVQDIDLNKKELFVKSDKSSFGRTLNIPECLLLPISNRIQKLKLKHEELGRLNQAQKLNKRIMVSDFRLHLLFPASKPGCDPTAPSHMLQRSDSFLSKAINKAAIKAGLLKRVTCHMFRHSYAVHLLERGYSIQTVHKLLGHADIRSTMIYKQVCKNNFKIISPLDELMITG